MCVPCPARYRFAAELPSHIWRDHACKGDNLAARAGDFQDHQSDRRSSAVENCIDTIDIVPLTRQIRCDVGFAGVIGDDEFNRLTEDAGTEILDSEARRGDRPLSRDNRVRPGQIGEYTNLNSIVRQ
jgi:hypothetical protein